MRTGVTQILRVVVTLLTGIAALSTIRAEAYPSFIGYGYTSCIVCHFNAFGNGPLTDYGHALGATAISGKPFYNSNISDQDYGDQSGFLGPVAFPDWLRLSAGYRGLYYSVFGQPGQKAQSRYINMQADGSIVTKFKDDQLIGVFSFGYLKQQTQPGQKADNFVSREHYVSYAVKRNIRIYAGFTDVVFGIRTPDHVSFARSLPKVTYADGVHGVAAHFGFSKAEVGVQLFAGNLFQSKAERQAGASVMGEYDLAEKVRIGASVLASTGEVRTRDAFALHMRAGVGHGSSLLLETGVVRDNAKIDTTKKTGAYLYTQTTTRMARGLHFLFTGEFMSRDAFRPSERLFRVGPGVQWFPLQRIELRADLWGERSIGIARDFEHPDTYEALMQVHLWF